MNDLTTMYGYTSQLIRHLYQTTGCVCTLQKEQCHSVTLTQFAIAEII